MNWKTDECDPEAKISVALDILPKQDGSGQDQAVIVMRTICKGMLYSEEIIATMVNPSALLLFREFLRNGGRVVLDKRVQ